MKNVASTRNISLFGTVRVKKRVKMLNSFCPCFRAQNFVKYSPSVSPKMSLNLTSIAEKLQSCACFGRRLARIVSKGQSIDDFRSFRMQRCNWAKCAPAKQLNNDSSQFGSRLPVVASSAELISRCVAAGTRATQPVKREERCGRVVSNEGEEEQRDEETEWKCHGE